ncbi:NAD(P)H-dependent oxidoreductase [Rhodosalinus sp.]|uniref:NAD(P)H-dependent oxidoreductase n=1 Tax=Rhodosalinus sp. TaxID=2047741 RepID=UPI00397DBC13
MRVLIVFCHPSEQSFGAALFAKARCALLDAGHEVQVIDLYREGFDPVLSPEDWHAYLSDTDSLIARVQGHVDALRRAEALVMIFPTWMYGPPALLKGWMERVWLPGVAFEVPQGKTKRAQGLLTSIRSFTVVTTSGSPWWWLRLIRDPGRSMLTRGYRVLFHPRCRVRWLQLHDMNHATERERQRFLARVERTLTRV